MKLTRKHHVVALLGGLGNQLFQFAFGIHLRQQSGLEVTYDASALRSGTRTLELAELVEDNALPVEAWLNFLPYPRGRFGPPGEWIRIASGPRRIFFETDGKFGTQSLADPGWWYGYWQYPSIVEKVLPVMRQSFDIPELVSGTIGIHVRRGDYVGNPILLSPEYYREALNTLIASTGIDRESCSVTVYSDDPSWCSQQLKFDVDVNYAPQASTLHDFRKLMMCEFLILSRSTFSWWAAVLPLRKPGRVVAPFPYVPHGGVGLEMDGWLLHPVT